VSKKNLPTLYFLNNSVKNWPILMIFGLWNPDKIWHQKLINLTTSPVSWSQFILLNPKSHLQKYYWLFVLSQKKWTKPWLFGPPHVNKSPQYLAKCRTCSSSRRYIVFLQMLVALKRAGCDAWQLECLTSNVTASVRSDHLLHEHTRP